METQTVTVTPPTEDTAVAEVIKRGETPIRIDLRRSPKGLTISMKVHPLVEEFMKNSGDGTLSDVRKVGRYWLPIGKDPQPLQAYGVSPNMSGHTFSDGLSYRLTNVGQPLLDVNNGAVNLSILRLAGISDPAGVTFGVPGPVTVSQLRALAQNITRCARHFYVEYMQPIEMSCFVNIQEIKL